MPLWTYAFSNLMLRPVFRIALDLRFEGLENLPSRGPAILAINHSSFVDPLLLGAIVQRPIVMMSKIENFRLPIFGWLVRLYGAFPIKRGEVDRVAIQTALTALREGSLLLMAPEGTRSKDGVLQKGHDGVAMLAARTSAPVLPVAIAGAYRVASNLKRLRRTRVTVRVGKPMAFKSEGERASRAEMSAFTERLMAEVAGMLPPEQRGRRADGDAPPRGDRSIA